MICKHCNQEMKKEACKGKNKLNIGCCFNWEYGIEGFEHRDHKTCCICNEVKK